MVLFPRDKKTVEGDSDQADVAGEVRRGDKVQRDPILTLLAERLLVLDRQNEYADVIYVHGAEVAVYSEVCQALADVARGEGGEWGFVVRRSGDLRDAVGATSAERGDPDLCVQPVYLTMSIEWILGS